VEGKVVWPRETIGSLPTLPKVKAGTVQLVIIEEKVNSVSAWYKNMASFALPWTCNRSIA